LWHKWDLKDKPWKYLLKLKDPVDRQLFFCSTIIHVGNGRDTPFWEGRWLHGAAPKDLTPSLYAIAKFKFRKFYSELQNLNWIRNLQGISNTSQLEEFTVLFMALSTVTLTDQRDEIIWRWTTNGQYTIASAYESQFNCAMSIFPATAIWKAITAPKCKIFVWVVMHDRVLTADNMIKKNWQCNSVCSLCFYMHETSHLVTQCNYTEATFGCSSF
jgi:hypothetical protein